MSGNGTSRKDNADKNLGEIVSEDFQHDRLYGSMRVRNPFLA